MEKESTVSGKLRTHLLERSSWRIKTLIGKSLTLIDSVIQDETSRKATKDLMHNIIGDYSLENAKDLNFAIKCLSKKLGEYKEPEKCLGEGNIFD